MKFLILSQYFPPEVGGPQTRLAAMSEELVRLGHEVEVVTALPNYPTGRIFEQFRGKLYSYESRHGVSVHRVWVYAAIGGGLKRLLNYVSFAATSLAGLLKAKKPDYIFAESPPLFLSLPAYAMSRLWRVPFIFNVSDLWPDSVRELQLLDSNFLIRMAEHLESWTYRKAAYVTAVTEGIHKSLAAKGVPHHKILFLPNGVDTTLFQPTPSDDAFKQRLGLAGKKIVVYQGSLGYAHGLENVLQAAKLLEKDSDIHFLFIGDGSDRKSLEAFCEGLELKNATFMNPVPKEELPRFFSIAMCGLASLRNLPLFEGARPSKIFPIMAAGKPVVFVGSGEAGRMINEALAGAVVQFGNPEALARVLREFAESPDLCSEMGENGRNFTLKHLQWSGLITAWLAQLAGHSTKAEHPSSQAVTVLQ